MNKPVQNITKPKRTPEEKDRIFALPLDEQFVVVYTNDVTGFSVYQHELVEEDMKDYLQVLEVAKAYTWDGDCRINPVIFPKAEEGRRKIFPGIESLKNPDLTTVFGYVDVKSPEQVHNIIRNANNASRQDAIVAITDLASGTILSERQRSGGSRKSMGISV